LNPDENQWDLGTPFWRSNLVTGESLFFIRESPETPPKARLLFPPVDCKLELTSASRETLYSFAAGDYSCEAATGILTLPEGSRIPFMDRPELYPRVGQEHCMVHKRGDEQVGLFFAEEHLFHDLQVQASYEHGSRWDGFLPRSQLDQLPLTALKLHSPEPMKICVIGDSISAGCNASALTGAPPGMPPYPDLLAGALRRQRPGPVLLENFAVSGTGMKYGLDVVEAVMKDVPDLVVIAYGMNDVGFNPVEDFASQAAKILEIIQARHRDTEVILVSSMLGNPEWVYTPTENFFIFRDALAALCGPGVVLADLSSLWADLLKVKSYHDLTGNGVNHPNDFGHRLYAQFLLDLLGFGCPKG
jgi:lysophospholipase L1-like esterase